MIISKIISSSKMQCNPRVWLWHVTACKPAVGPVSQHQLSKADHRATDLNYAPLCICTGSSICPKCPFQTPWLSGIVTFPGKAFLTSRCVDGFFSPLTHSLNNSALITPNGTHLCPYLPRPLGYVLLESKDRPSSPVVLAFNTAFSTRYALNVQ